MLAMLDHALTSKHGAISRFLSTLNRNGGFTVRRMRILGAPVLHIILQIEQDIKPRILNRRLDSVRRYLSGAGASSICFTHGFQYGDYFTRSGFIEPDSSRLYEALACQAIHQWPCVGETAYFSAPRMNTAGLKSLAALCERFRYVLADVTSDSGEYFRDMQRRFGVSVIENPASRQIRDADAAVLLCPRAGRETVELSNTCVVYAVNENALLGVRYKRRVVDVEFSLPPVRDSELSDGFPRAQLAAHALNMLTLPQDSITLCAVAIADV